MWSEKQALLLQLEAALKARLSNRLDGMKIVEKVVARATPAFKSGLQSGEMSSWGAEETQGPMQICSMNRSKISVH